jgi:carboxyl-terminal processing protease
VLLERRVFLRELMNEFRGTTSVRAGCEVTELDGRLFVGGMNAGSAAEQAGLLVGDEVLAVDGQDPRAVLDPAGHDPALPGPPGFFFNLTPEAHTFSVRRVERGPTLELTLTPSPDSQVEACRKSVQVVEHDGARIGVIRLYHFIHGRVVSILDEALKGPFADVDALVLDVRGRGGQPRVVTQILDRFSGRRASWKKPVVCLVDGGSRSAKEAFAYGWRKRQIGPLIGETTAGAVIACTFQQLSDGSVICLPIQDATRLTDGVVLEGVGVDPTEPVAQHPLPFRQGRDAIRAAGIARAAELAQGAAGVRSF